MSHVGDLQGVLDGGDRGWPLGVQLFGRDDLICAQQFLVKGLLRSDTELCTIEVSSAPLHTSALHGIHSMHLQASHCDSLTSLVDIFQPSKALATSYSWQ